MTPKQRREQDILKRKTSDINKKYPQMPEHLSEIKGNISDKENEYIRSQMKGQGLEDESLKPGKEYMMKKGGMTNGQKKVGKVMSEFKAGKLKSSSGKKVTNPKQAIAIGLSEAGMSKKKMQNGGMVRGQGAAIRGTKFKGIF